MPWKKRTHFTPAITGHRELAAANCIPIAANRPGVTKRRYESPSTVPRRSTSPPTPPPMAPRKRRGMRKLTATDPRHNRAYTRASRSTTRNIVDMVTSVLEGAPGQGQEDVLQGAAAHEDGGGLEPVARDGFHHGVAVAGVDQDAVGKALDPTGAIADPVET